MENTLPVASIGSNEPLMVEVISSSSDDPIAKRLDQVVETLKIGFNGLNQSIGVLAQSMLKQPKVEPAEFVGPQQPDEPTETGGGEVDTPQLGFFAKFREQIAGLGETFSNVGLAIKEAGGGDIQDGFSKLGQGLGVLGPIVSVAKDIFEKVTGVFQIVKGFGKLIFNSVSGVVGGIKSGIGSIFGSSEEQQVDESREENKDAIEGHTEAVENAVASLEDRSEDEKKVNKNTISERMKMNKGLNKFNMGIILVIAAILAVIFAFKNNMFAALGQIGKQVALKVGSIGQGIKTGIEKSVKSISDGAKIVKDKFAKTADDVAKGLKARFPKATEAVKNAATKTKDVVKGGLEKGKNFFQKVGSGIKNAAGGAIDKVKSGAKVVAEKASKAGSVVKGAGKQLIKRLPFIGAVVEGGLDAKDNTQRFNVIKEAYENEIPIVPVDPNNADAGKRPITKEEFEEQEQIYKASLAGSTGKAAGAGGGAAAGAAAGAAIGSVVPIVGTIAGGIIGAVIGGWFGGKAGDKAATEIAEAGMGVDNVNELDSSLVAAASNYMNAEKLESANGEIADMKTESSGASVNAPTVVDQSSQTINESYTTTNTNMNDSQLGYSTA
jgi:uncharacterized protein (DUF697 family)